MSELGTALPQFVKIKIVVEVLIDREFLGSDTKEALFMINYQKHQENQNIIIENSLLDLQELAVYNNTGFQMTDCGVN